tara:strand:+ start:99 stop:368 length:270 start_codon:yes stop_codon:yes gene_type:complete
MTTDELIQIKLDIINNVLNDYDRCASIHTIPYSKQFCENYKQSLLDIENQSGYPDSVTWPTPEIDEITQYIIVDDQLEFVSVPALEESE